MHDVTKNIIRLSCLVMIGAQCVSAIHAQQTQNLPTPVDPSAKGSLIKPDSLSIQEMEKNIKIEKAPPAPPPVVVVEEVKPAAGTYEEVLFYEKQCRAKKDINCVKAGTIIMSEKPPQQIYDLDSAARAKRALRLYEIAIAVDNFEAMEYAYDLYYDPYTILRAFNSFGDKSRAMEIREVMVSKNYAGGMIRLAQDYLENPEYLLSLGKKKEACQIIKQNTTNNDLTNKSKEIVNTLKNDLTCKVIN